MLTSLITGLVGCGYAELHVFESKINDPKTLKLKHY